MQRSKTSNCNHSPTTGINWRRAENKNNSASGYGVLICKISI
nr:MAG TPA: hypothetical protein [Caudoviricetes sp.]